MSLITFVRTCSLSLSLCVRVCVGACVCFVQWSVLFLLPDSNYLKSTPCFYQSCFLSQVFQIFLENLFSQTFLSVPVLEIHEWVCVHVCVCVCMCAFVSLMSKHVCVKFESTLGCFRLGVQNIYYNYLCTHARACMCVCDRERKRKRKREREKEREREREREF